MNKLWFLLTVFKNGKKKITILGQNTYIQVWAPYLTFVQETLDQKICEINTQGAIQKLRWHDFGHFRPLTYDWLTFFMEFLQCYEVKSTYCWHYPYYPPTLYCQWSSWLPPNEKRLGYPERFLLFLSHQCSGNKTLSWKSHHAEKLQKNLDLATMTITLESVENLRIESQSPNMLLSRHAVSLLIKSF